MTHWKDGLAIIDKLKILYSVVSLCSTTTKQTNINRCEHEEIFALKVYKKLRPKTLQRHQTIGVGVQDCTYVGQSLSSFFKLC